MNPYQKAGDYVVGKYNEMGHKIKDGEIIGGEEAADLIKQILDHGKYSGGVVVQGAKKATPKKRGPKKKVDRYASEVEPEAPIWEEFMQNNEVPEPVQQEIEVPEYVVVPVAKAKKKIIYLYNQLGKIRLMVEAILECEHSYCLVFASDDDLIFTPNKGETLNLTLDDGNTVPVYYPDALFDWMDGEKKLMILFKADE